jgi:thiosulfate/3-mercaptopyruvate sulfurtransferase
MRSPTADAGNASPPAATAPFLSPGRLRRLLDRSGPGRVVPVDARAPRQYREGHIPGAINLPARELNPVEDGVRRLVGAEALERILGRLDGDPELVLYGSRGGADAAHLWWTLRAFGHRRTRILDGGIEGWQAEGGALEGGTGAPAAETPSSDGGATERTEPDGNRGNWLEADGVPSAGRAAEGNERTSADASRFVFREEIERRLRDPDVAIVDTREPEEFSGQLVAARRGGHIPGALLFPWTSALTGDLRLRPEAELRELLAPVLERPEAFVYCQSGMRAAHTAAVLEMLEHPRPRLYLGSWSEWGNREDAPIESEEAGS